MEKIKLVDQTTLEINSISVKDNKMLLAFTGAELSSLRQSFNNKYNLATIEVLNEGNAVCAVYNGYKKVEQFIITPGETETINVTLVKQDELEERLESVESAIETLILSELGAM